MSCNLPVRTHLLLPALAFGAAMAVFAFTDLDRTLAGAWAFDARNGDFIARRAVWANAGVHGGGRNLVWLIVVACAGLAAAGWFFPGKLSARWPVLVAARTSLLWAVLGIALATGVIGGLKNVTNIDCPWDLAGFGGSHAYVKWFEPRLPGSRGVCFPGGHSGSAFALVALYFAFRDSHRGLARACLAAALALGALFAFAQEARGAHFLSHDLTSAWLAWTLCFLLYALRRRLSSDRAGRGRPAGSAAGTMR